MNYAASISFVRRLAEKWHEVPLSRLGRTSTRSLFGLPDGELLDIWEQARAETSDGLRGLNVRGWFHRAYGPWLTEKKVIDVGPGLGIDSVALARRGCAMTLVDVSDDNLRLVQRIFALKSLPPPTAVHLDSFERLDELAVDYDAVVAFGSLHHIPAADGKPEFEALARRLKGGGRFIMHAYPYQRWIDEGRLAFDQWGETTDGVGTPWAEWYDTRKLLQQLRPARFAPLLYCEYHGGWMNCIDLVKVDGDPSLEPRGVPTDAAPAPGILEFNELAVQGGWDAQLVPRPDGAVVVTTPDAAWGYAASSPFRGERLPPQSTRCFVTVNASVLEGRVGIGLLMPDGREFAIEEYLTTDDGGPLVIELTLSPSRMPAQFVVRNAAGRPVRSRVVIQSIDVHSA